MTAGTSLASVATVAWCLEVADRFVDWWERLTEDERVSVDAMLRLLEYYGPGLREPYCVDLPEVAGIAVRRLRAAHDSGDFGIMLCVDQWRARILLLSGGGWMETAAVSVDVVADIRAFVDEDAVRMERAS